jgi:raffinose/stachyose/melibiose transport system permease protein
VVFSVLAIVPLVGLFLAAFHAPGEAVQGFSVPDGLDSGNFSKAWEAGGLGSALRSSAIITVTVVVVSSVCSILAGYAFGTMRFRGSTALFYFFLVGLVMPFEATIVPLFYDLRDLSLTDTYWAVILPSTALSIAFGTFWMRAFFLSTPRSLSEAARIDGAGSLELLWRVLLPVARPAVTTMAVLIFVYTWNDFLLSLVMLSDPAVQTAPVKLALFVGRRVTDIGALAAASIIVMLPVVVVYLFAQRHFIRGMLSGAVKG